MNFRKRMIGDLISKINSLVLKNEILKISFSKFKIVILILAVYKFLI